MTDKPKFPKKPKKIIGRVEPVFLTEHADEAVPGRIDTGAKSSSIWASNIKETDGTLQFCLFGPDSKLYTGRVHSTHHFWRTVVASSMGATQERYVVRLRIRLRGKRIIARFTLADRSTQVYPVLVGRNVLRGKFIVDVNLGKPDREGEDVRHEQLLSRIKDKR
jgi:hypothetical protein